MGDSSTVEQRTLTPLILVRIQVPQPLKSLLYLRSQRDRFRPVGRSVGSFCSGFELSYRTLGECWIAREVVGVEDCTHVIKTVPGEGRNLRLRAADARQPRYGRAAHVVERHTDDPGPGAGLAPRHPEAVRCPRLPVA